MSQPGGPAGPGQPPSGPPDWQSAPTAPQQPGGWQSAPPPAQAAAPSWQSPPQAPQPPGTEAPSWQAAPRAPTAPPPPSQASWQSAPRPPVAPSVPPPPPPSWMANLTSTAPVAGPAGFVYADVPNRIFAYIIDMIVLGVIGFLVAMLAGGLFGGITTQVTSTNGLEVSVNYGAFLAVAVINLIIGALYFIWMWSAQRGTVGMKVLGLQIGEESSGRSITMNQGFTRWLIIGIPSILAQFTGYLSAGLGFILGLIGLIWLLALLWSIAQSPTKQGYHDRYAHTIMVKASRRAA